MSTKKILVLCWAFGSAPPCRLLSVSLTRLLMSDASSAFFLSARVPVYTCSNSLGTYRMYFLSTARLYTERTVLM
ncbi:hypothetical protein KTR02_20085 [Bacteroides uniformis]|nr:hypothetical protein [Bacteroides uniformis]MBV3487037.1 hypothetical protein [Bacteroides uniformis]MBV3551543.1 hypothetical protein [Bacteroides uniformis]